jgi:hypothetical protein
MFDIPPWAAALATRDQPDDPNRRQMFDIPEWARQPGREPMFNIPPWARGDDQGDQQGDQPGAPTGRPTAATLQAAIVQRGNGPYQCVERMLGSGFSHSEKMALVRALQQQYREELNTRPELAGRKADMSDLRVGAQLLREDNFDAVMQKLGQSHPELQARIMAKLTGAGDDGAGFSPGGRQGRYRPGMVPGSDNGPVVAQWQARGTCYYPANNSMEGGHFDRKGQPLHTLQEFLANPEGTPYVSVAMDTRVAPYGTQIHIEELDAQYRDQLAAHGLEHIPFRIVDTGGAFRGRGTSRIDVCVGGRQYANDPTINGRLTIDVVGNSDQAAPRQQGPDQQYGMDPQYGGMDPRYGGMDPRYGGMDPRYGGMDPRYSGMDPRYGGMDPRYGGMDPRYGGMDPRYGGMDPRYGGMDPRYGAPSGPDPRYRLQPGMRNDGPPPGTPYDQNPDQGQAPQGPTYRTVADRQRFYNNQKNSWACAEYSIGMAIADKKLGRPCTDAEVMQIARASGNYGHGWNGGAEAIAANVRRYGVNAEAHPGRVDMDAFDRDLSMPGRSAIIDVRNPLTGNGHYIYVAGKTQDGLYIIGDPNGRSVSIGHDRPVTRQHLAQMMAAAPVAGYTTVWGTDQPQASPGRQQPYQQPYDRQQQYQQQQYQQYYRQQQYQQQQYQQYYRQQQYQQQQYQPYYRQNPYQQQQQYQQYYRQNPYQYQQRYGYQPAYPGQLPYTPGQPMYTPDGRPLGPQYRSSDGAILYQGTRSLPMAFIDNFVSMLGRQGTVGWCAQGVRKALEGATGTSFDSGGSAVNMGSNLVRTGLFDVVDLRAARNGDVRKGDIIVRRWTDETHARDARSHGRDRGNLGDIGAVRAVGPNGQFWISNDHHERAPFDWNNARYDAGSIMVLRPRVARA